METSHHGKSASLITVNLLCFPFYYTMEKMGAKSLGRFVPKATQSSLVRGYALPEATFYKKIGLKRKQFMFLQLGYYYHLQKELKVAPGSA